MTAEGCNQNLKLQPGRMVRRDLQGQDDSRANVASHKRSARRRSWLLAL